MAIVRTGMLWPSLIRWLVILIGGSSLEVGGTVAPVGGAEAGSMYAQGHRKLGAIVVPNRRSGRWAGVKYRSARRAQGERRQTQRSELSASATWAGWQGQ